MATIKATGRENSPVSKALTHLKKADPLLYKASLPFHQGLKKDSATASRKRYSTQKLFESLAGAITGQQLSTKAADTIWGRLKVACGGAVTPEAILRLRVPTLRKAGLSAAKVKSLKALSKEVASGELKLIGLRKMPEEEAVARLSAIWGIGRWTAEMFLMFALEREDVFSPGDLGLRRSMESIYSLPKDVHIKELELIAQRWSPHRTIASRILWLVRDTTSD